MSALMLLCATSSAHAEEEPICVYRARATTRDPSPGLQPHGSCAIVKGDRSLEIQPAHLAALDYDNELATLRVGRGWYYVARDGRTARVVTIDNGADVFSEGFARTIVLGKVGFIDSKLRVAIPARYDFAWPFDRGFALVCVACANAPPDRDGHTSVVGGQWGYIDPSGESIVPIQFTRETVRSRRPTRVPEPIAP